MTAAPCGACWPFDCLGQAAQATCAGEVHAAVARLLDFLEVFHVELACERAAARLMAVEAGEPEGCLVECSDAQRERLRGLLAWAAAVAEGAGEWHGGRL